MYSGTAVVEAVDSFSIFPNLRWFVPSADLEYYSIDLSSSNLVVVFPWIKTKSGEDLNPGEITTGLPTTNVAMLLGFLM